jgi:hypothetical protein
VYARRVRRSRTKRAAASGSSCRPTQKIHFMKTVARCYVAGLSLAALARLGGAVERSLPRGPLARSLARAIGKRRCRAATARARATGGHERGRK